MKAHLIAMKDIPDQGTQKIDFFGREALAYKVDGVPRVALNYCQHLGGPLELKDGKFTCNWHGAEFSCRTGLCEKGPATKGSKLIFLPTQIENGDLYYIYGE